jgi:PHD/YefM family antitoxin component YafN of YafNO toxin-antitoxin module
MKILSRAIVSNSDMIKNYKACREKSEDEGKIFILKNNQPDAVLFSIGEYERIAAFIEYLESHSDEEIELLIKSLPNRGHREEYTLKELRSDIQ